MYGNSDWVKPACGGPTCGDWPHHSSLWAASRWLGWALRVWTLLASGEAQPGDDLRQTGLVWSAGFPSVGGGVWRGGGGGQ